MWKCDNAFSGVIRELYITIFSTFYIILQPNFTMSLNLGRSFQLSKIIFELKSLSNWGMVHCLQVLMILITYKTRLHGALG